MDWIIFHFPFSIFHSESLNLSRHSEWIPESLERPRILQMANENCQMRNGK